MTEADLQKRLGLAELLTRLWRHLRPRRRRQFIAVTLLMMVSALAEVMTLGAVIPFISVLVEPEKVFRFGVVASFANWLGITDPEDLLAPLAAVFIVGALVAAGLRLMVMWASVRLSVVAGVDLSADAYERTLRQPYAVHLGRNSSAVVSGVVQKVDGVISGMFFPLQMALGSALTALTVLVALIAMDPIVAAVAVVGFGGSYVVITWMARRRLERNGERIAAEQTRVIKAIHEGIGGIRDVVIDGSQEVFLEQFRRSNRPLRMAQGSNSVMQTSPRVLMDGLTMLLIALLAIYLNGRTGGVVDDLPTLGALAIGGQRLLPVYQHCYYGVTTVLGNRAVLSDALELLDQPMPDTGGPDAVEQVKMTSGIRCRDLRFRYSDDGPWVVDGIDLAIDAGSTVGFVGPTGCGKTTLLDLLMGLLEPSSGSVEVDGVRLGRSSVRGWQRNLAHVPQHIFLADATVAENVAFGVSPDQIDGERVRAAARRALVDSFVDAEEEGYDTLVGERGARLSGGQRQRIGIARALYKDADILILDEATSALDNNTERRLMESITGWGGGPTILMVAHRLSTLRTCDVIFEMVEGRVVARGTYDELLGTSPTFRAMAQGDERGLGGEAAEVRGEEV
ncbi:MAG: ABC transporter ATP-binding protein [Acidimicrobiaceae bacterium]|mgnify:FL=1|nr:ABC transporter ATP-binding protein [Acidimicrobiaceae bacterium]